MGMGSGQLVRGVGLRLALLVAIGLSIACEPSVSSLSRRGTEATATTTSWAVRAERPLFDGAPPVVPHGEFGMSCASCHHGVGMVVPELGWAPASPHETDPAMSSLANCRQCHVQSSRAEPLVGNAFVGLPQDLRRGVSLNALAPPVIPHGVFLRENCTACHAGLAAREEIRTSHPERTNCRQCHLEQTTTAAFSR